MAIEVPFHRCRRQSAYCGTSYTREETRDMLETIIVLLLILWLVGLVTSNTFGGILHLLLLVAVVVFVIRLLTGRRAV
jgi:hypothetical protein